MAYVISDAEAEDILRKAGEFQREIEDWFSRSHPRLIS